MPKIVGQQRLSAAQARAFSGPGKLDDGGGLMLVATKSGSKSWIVRMTIKGRRVDRGLGGYPLVPLAEARRRAAELREALAHGSPPPSWKTGSTGNKPQRSAPATPAKTVRKAFADFFRDKAPRLRNRKHAAQWGTTLETYAFATIGDRPVADVTPAEVVAALRPIWHTRPETARRVLQRLGNVFDAAIFLGYRTAANPARGVSSILGRERPDPQHHAALPHQDIPAMLARLQAKSAASPSTRLCLEFLILTAARSGEARGARWGEIDFEGAVWTIPADRMKAGLPHRVPLSRPALAVLEEARRIHGHEYALVFPGTRGILSDNTLSKCLRGLVDGATPHGFRSAFKDWCAIVAKVPDEASEAALAHRDRNRVRAAYLRTDHLEARCDLMARWGAFCSTQSA